MATDERMTDRSASTTTTATATATRRGRGATPLASLMVSWERSLRAGDLSWRTIASYDLNVQAFLNWLDSQHPGASTTAGVTRAHCEAYLTERLASGSKPGSVFTYHKCLRLFFRWLVDEEEMTDSPMTKVRAPAVPEKPPAVISDDQLRALIRVCAGNDFLARRDLAMVRLLIDTGMRHGELGGLLVSDIDFDARTARLRGSSTQSGDPFGAKNHRARVVPFGVQTTKALDRYLRARAAHRHADLLALWLSSHGHISYSGLAQAIQHRAQQAGIPAHIWPHLFRHTATDRQLRRGDQEGDIITRMGWRSRDMLGRYGASVAAERAIESYHRQPSPGDLL